jgi:hypothetical protein
MTYLKSKLSVAVVNSSIVLASGVLTAQAADEVYNDPSDVTRLVTSVSPVIEFHRYENEDLPDDSLWEVKVEGQYSRESILLLADVGYGHRTGTNESGIVDSRVRFFHVPYRNDNDSAWVSSAGWSIDSYIPFGNVDKGLGSGNWVLAPGIIWTHNLPVVTVAPNLSYQITWANDDLDDDIGSGEPDDSRAVRAEINLAVDVPDRYWLLVTPAYTWGLRNTDDGGFIKVFTGINLNTSMSLGLEVQWNYDVRNGVLQDVMRGEKYRARIQWEIYY